MKILAVSDVVVGWIYSPKMRLILSDIDLAIGCGDLPPYYLEYIINALDIPLFNVNGNHSISENVHSDHHSRGLIDLHCKVMRYKGYTFAGVEGSMRYKNGAYQYTQIGMWLNVFKIVPSLLLNRLKFGKYLDVFVSHAPAWGIHDQSDLAHRGSKAFRWLLTIFQPDYYFHGHIHIYRPDMITVSQFGKTKVINTFGYRKVEI